jgi:signal transduction histidine kinase
MARAAERSGTFVSSSLSEVPGHDTWASRIVLSLLLFILVSVLSFFPVIRDFGLRSTDTFFRLMPRPPQRSSVVLVLIDDESLHQYGRWPWSRDVLGSLVSKITKAGAGVIGLDVLLSEAQTAATDSALEQSLKESARTVIVGKVGAFADGPHWVEPLPQFSASSIAVGHVHAVLDEDGICRRFPPLELTIDGPRWAFAVELARRSDPHRVAQFLDSYTLPADNDSSHVISARPVLARIFFRRDGFDTISAATLLRDAQSETKLAGRPVLIGFGTAELTDRLNTPIATELPSPGVEVHAQILDGILSGHLIKDVPLALNALSLAAICFLVVILFRRWHGAASIALLLTLAGGVYATAFFTFYWTMRIVWAGPMLLAVVLSPLVLYAADFTLVERSLTRQLLALRAWLAKQGQDATPVKSGLSWKLALLQKLGTELGALYELHQTLLESTLDLVAIFDERGQLLLKNRSFADALPPGGSSLTLEQLSAKWTWESDAPLVRKGSVQEGEVHLNGTLYAARFTPLPPTSLSPAGGTLITLTSLQTRVERDRARGEVLAFITHELRTPLASIQGFADLMIRYPGSPDCEGAPEMILRESKRLLALINSYLDVLRLDAGAKPLQGNVFDLTNTVHEVFEILRPLAAAADMRLVLQTDTATVAAGDANLISGAVLNLVSNAIKYGKRGTDIEVTCSATTQEVVIGVRNQGKVISVGDIPHLFDPYYRAEEVQKAKPGWGLGLAFVKRIAEKHGGSVEVQSEASGTVFEIHLPVEPGAAVPSEVSS